jgi:phosphoribosylamine--glycine ligase
VAADATSSEPVGVTAIGPARVMVVGAGGREHALAWKLAAEPGIEMVLVAPGSAAIASEPLVEIAAIPATSIDAIVASARERRIDLVVVGPEGPLADGLADALIGSGIPVFGPTRAAAAIEWSKAFCHDVAASAGVRMARSETCRSRSAAERAIEHLRGADGGFVVKDDGLAAGKGVTVFGPGDTPEGLAGRWLDEAYGPSTPDRAVVVEERLRGPEVSVIAICDGQRAVALPAARDHKRLDDGDQGPNTGGMGAYSPVPDFDDGAVERTLADVHHPILQELAARGTPFRGFLYAGLILTSTGPVLLECNARLGDPETQVILPRLDGALGPILLAAATGELPGGLPARLPSQTEAAVGIVLAGGRYPTESSVGEPIIGIDAAQGLGSLVFHSGTARTNEGWVTSGGRILTVVGRGPDVAAARDVAEVAADAISFPGQRRRRDVGVAAHPAEVGAR